MSLMAGIIYKEIVLMAETPMSGNLTYLFEFGVHSHSRAGRDHTATRKRMAGPVL